MKFCTVLIVLIICTFFSEIFAGRGYVYKKQNYHLADFIEGGDETYDNNDNLTNSQEDIFPLRRPSRFNRCENCNCGWPNNNRIVGGSAVQYNKYPWIAQLLSKGQFYCGAALINNLYLLTAAHCVDGFSASSISAIVLQFDRSIKGHGIHRNVVGIIKHPRYSTITLDNDIALLKLNTPIPLQSTLRPVCLPDPSSNFEYLNAIAAGWGLTKEGGKVSNILNEVTVPVITNTECRATRYKKMITDNMLCAGNVQVGGKDACQGDSGGPLIVKINNSYKLAGVVSYGYGCAQKNAPGVYARVSKYLDWIRDNTQDSCYCRQ